MPVIINNWSITPLHTFDPYQPPETVAKGLHGIVTGHKSFEDGAEVTTSQMVSLTREGDNVIVGTISGSSYLLGTTDPEYEKLYPLARERLIKSWLGSLAEPRAQEA